MYSPPLGTFLSRDPRDPNGVDLLDYNSWFGNRLTRVQNLYGYASNNPINRVDPTGLVDKPAAPTAPTGVWECARFWVLQNTVPVVFDETFVHDCKDCKEKCRIRVTAARCFHESVAFGDDRDPNKFYTTFHVDFIHTKRRCDGKQLPDYSTAILGCVLRPGRLVFPGGPLSQAVVKYLDTLKSCKDFDLTAMCNAVSAVPLHTAIK